MSKGRIIVLVVLVGFAIFFAVGLAGSIVEVNDAQNELREAEKELADANKELEEAQLAVDQFIE